MIFLIALFQQRITGPARNGYNYFGQQVDNVTRIEVEFKRKRNAPEIEIKRLRMPMEANRCLPVDMRED